MRKYKRIKGWYVIGEHCGFPVYMKSGIQKRPYVWRRGEYHSLKQIERMGVDRSGKVRDAESEVLDRVWSHVVDMESTAKNARDCGEMMASEYVVASSRRLRKLFGFPIIGDREGNLSPKQ